MESVFGAGESKLDRRRKFEKRMWSAEESFANYFNDKCLLGGELNLGDEELADYLIEGVPDRQLRNQARLQNFTTANDVLRAFRSISLPEHTEPKQRTVERMRCYNCNCSGHYAKDCRKPKREAGSCFACGQLGHYAAECKQHKKNKNTFVSYFKLYVSAHTNRYMFIECLVDSGSPVSLIKQVLVPAGAKLEEVKNVYYGLNKSPLNISGKMICFIEVLNKCVSVELLVVPNGSMGCPVLLGRDFIEASDAKLKIGNVEFMDRVAKIEVENVVSKSKVEKIYSVEKVSNLILANEGACGKVNEVSVRNEDTTDDNTNISEVLREVMAIDVCGETDLDLKLGEQLSYNEKTGFQAMFRRIYVNSKSLDEPLVRKEIRLALESDKPFSCPPRRLSYSEKEELQKIIDEYLAKGYIRPSESEFVSAIVLVKKKTGELRLCVDYRKLNKVTVKDNYPMPLIDDLLDRLANKKVFTKLDLKNGFFHVFVEKDSIKYTSFTTPLGQYEFLRMPFGLKNAPATFQRFINKIFADMIRSGEVIVYLDDLMIATQSVQQHLEILEKVMLRIVQNNLELRLDKCEFLQSKVSYLGYVITDKGIQADEKGLKAINNFSVPTKVQEVQSFLGLCSYFRRFIKDFATIAKPLHDLTKKDKKFQFMEAEIESFNSLKEKLIASPLLAIFDPSDATELHCDASTLGFGAILLQKKKDGKLNPVFYFSKGTTDAESKYPSFELEALAIVYALKRFRVYLQGIKFKVVTDCNSLTLALNKKDMNPRIARWALELQNYDYEVEHRSGKRMQHVDALSRINNVLVIHANTFEENLIVCQSRDERIRKVKKELEVKENSQYEMRNGVVYKKKDNDLLFYVPEPMEQHVLYKYHDEMGHLGVDKVIETVGKSYWFPNIRKKTAAHIENCLKCIAFSNKGGKKEGLLHMIPKGNVPFEMVHIDHYGPVHSKCTKYKHILVIIDAFPKFVRLYPAKTTASKEAVTALKDYFRAYSRPKFIVSDRGTCFTSKEFEELLEERGIEHIKVATSSPQANGQVEIVNKTLGPMLAKMVDSEKEIRWEKVLESAEYAMNNTVHRATKEQPSVLLFGVRQRGKFVDSVKENVVEPAQNSTPAIIENVRKQAELEQIKAQSYNKTYSDMKRREPRKFSLNDYVVVSNTSSQVGASSKLIPKYKGPYRVTKILENDRYVVEDVEGFQQTQIPYKGTWSVTNLKPWCGFKRSLGKNTEK